MFRLGGRKPFCADMLWRIWYLFFVTPRLISFCTYIKRHQTLLTFRTLSNKWILLELAWPPVHTRHQGSRMHQSVHLRSASAINTWRSTCVWCCIRDNVRYKTTPRGIWDGELITDRECKVRASDKKFSHATCWLSVTEKILKWIKFPIIKI